MAPRSWGEWQIAERKKRGWSQLALCRESGVSERSLKRYEAGGSPRGEAVFQILSAFGFPVPDRVPLATNMEVVELRRQVEDLAAAAAALAGDVEWLVRALEAFDRERDDRLAGDAPAGLRRRGPGGRDAG